MHSCSVILGSDLNPDPAAFDDHEWIAAPYTLDGKTVYALVHDEYHAWERPGQCPTVTYDVKCWYNAVTLAVSTDGGATYVDVPPRRLVASVPYRYVPGDGPTGIFSPSNIVHNERDGFYYALVYVNVRESYVGNCLIRTKDLGDPGSWRAWSGGSSFAMTFVDPYTSNQAPAAHLCAPVSRQQPGTCSRTASPTARRQDNGFSSARRSEELTSRSRRDLLHWTPPKLFLAAQITWNYQCGDPDPIAYPSVIDPKSTSRNFQTVGKTVYLYFTQFHYTDCQQTLDRDLVRVPIQISPR